jgi:hypothetical protein
MSSGKLEYKRVVALARPHLDKLLELHVQGEAAPLRATPVHPFWVRRGSKVAGWVEAARLQPGDLILTDSGKWNRVTAVSRLPGEQTVYNFEVADDHDYFVDKPGLLVHNAGCAPGTGTRAFGVGWEDGYPAAQAAGANVLQLSPEAQAAFDAGNLGPMQAESASWAAGATGENADVYYGSTGAGDTFWDYEFPELLNNLLNGTLGQITFHF